MVLLCKHGSGVPAHSGLTDRESSYGSTSSKHARSLRVGGVAGSSIVTW
jgi:hypothetical protein